MRARQRWGEGFMGLATSWDYLCSISADNWAMTTEIESLNQGPHELRGERGWSRPFSLTPHLPLTPFQVEVGDEVQRALLGQQATCG